MVEIGSHGSVVRKGVMIEKRFKMREIYHRELFIYKLIGEHPYVLILDSHYDNTICLESMDGDILDLFPRSLGERIYMLDIMISNIGSAINYINTMGISHCDIKPSNILYRIERNSIKFKLADFSCSRIRKHYDLQLYTPQYRAVELISDIGGDTYHCDIWAFGITCLDFLLGERIIRETNMVGILKFLYEMRTEQELTPKEFILGIENSSQNSFNIESILHLKGIICPEILVNRIKKMLYYSPEDRSLRKEISTSNTINIFNTVDVEIPQYIDLFIEEHECSEEFFEVMKNISCRLSILDVEGIKRWILSLYIASILVDDIFDLDYIINILCRIDGKWIDRLSIVKILDNVSFFDIVAA